MADFKKIYTDLLNGKQFIGKINLAKRYEYMLESDAPAVADDRPPTAQTPSLANITSEPVAVDVIKKRAGRPKGSTNKTPEQKAALKDLQIKNAKEDYDNTIKEILGDLQHVKLHGISIGSKSIAPADLPVWKALFYSAPKKKGEKEGQSKGSGNGELSLYWFLKNSGISIEDTRGGNKPDFTAVVDGAPVGIEVKSYSKISNNMLQLGRFRNISDPAAMDNVKMLNALFGYSVLVKAFTYNLNKGSSPVLAMEAANNYVIEKDKEKNEEEEISIETSNADNWTGAAILELFKNLDLVEDICIKILDANANLGNENIVVNMINNVQSIYDKLGLQPVIEDKSVYVKKLFLNIINERLGTKPGDKGYIVNVASTGKMDWHKLDLDSVATKINLGSLTARGAFLNVSLDLFEKV